MEPELEARLDDWRRRQPEIPTRAEAARRLLVFGLEVAEETEADLDTWRKAHPERPTRVDAAVRLLRAALRAALRGGEA